MGDFYHRASVVVILAKRVLRLLAVVLRVGAVANAEAKQICVLHGCLRRPGLLLLPSLHQQTCSGTEGRAELRQWLGEGLPAGEGSWGSPLGHVMGAAFKIVTFCRMLGGAAFENQNRFNL